MLKFITGNKTKFKEVRAMLAPIKIQQLNIDLQEIQGLDSRQIIKHKLLEALKHQKGQFIIDDSSLYLKCFDYKLPGPLVKWFNMAIGDSGYAKLVKHMGENLAKAQTIIGYVDYAGAMLFFEGAMNGKIVRPRGSYSFGYDPVFMPEGKSKTLSQMKAAGNFFACPRGLAIIKLKQYSLKQTHNEKRQTAKPR